MGGLVAYQIEGYLRQSLTSSMANFIKGIEVNGKVVGFSFTSVCTANGMRYYVSVLDRNFKPYLFHMEFRNGQWVIIDAPKVPQWIHDVRDQLCEAIRQQTGN